MQPLEERVATAPASDSQAIRKMKMTTDIPPEITTPDSVETRIGSLEFFDGFPDDKTTQLVYDNLDFMRWVQAFLRGIPGASILAFLPAARKFGGVNGNVMLFEELMDSKALWLTPNNSNFHFFEEIHEVLEMEPNEALDPETLGLFASIGLQKGKPFAPDERMKKILIEAVAVGNATARALTFRNRNAEGYIYPGSSWWIPSSSGFQFLLAPGVFDLDNRPAMHYWPRAPRPRCLPRWSVEARNTLARLPTVHTRGSTAARPTKCICHRTSRRKITGPSPCMTTRRARVCRPINASPASTVSTKASRLTRTARQMSGLPQSCQTESPRRTGRRPFPVKAGICFSASTAPSSPCSTKPGVWVRLSG
jgi:hypothetical protein